MPSGADSGSAPQEVVRLCRGHTGTVGGYLCSACEGKCVMCEASGQHVALCRLATVCRECYQRPRRACILCGAPGTAPAYYCERCVLLERDRDGCPVRRCI